MFEYIIPKNDVVAKVIEGALVSREFMLLSDLERVIVGQARPFEICGQDKLIEDGLNPELQHKVKEGKVYHRQHHLKERAVAAYGVMQALSRTRVYDDITYTFEYAIIMPGEFPLHLRLHLGLKGGQNPKHFEFDTYNATRLIFVVQRLIPERFYDIVALEGYLRLERKNEAEITKEIFRVSAGRGDDFIRGYTGFWASNKRDSLAKLNDTQKTKLRSLLPAIAYEELVKTGAISVTKG